MFPSAVYAIQHSGYHKDPNAPLWLTDITLFEPYRGEDRVAETLETVRTGTVASKPNQRRSKRRISSSSKKRSATSKMSTATYQHHWALDL